MDQEYAAFLHNKTPTLVSPTPQCNIIGCKWVFRIKYNPNGTVSKHKVRLVAKRFHQKEGIDFYEPFSQVVKYTTIRVVLTIALTHNWPINNGDLSESIYMEQPSGYEQGDRSLVCKHHKAIYGLKQAPRAWFQKLHSFLTTSGFQSTKSNVSLFTKVTPS